MSLANKVPSDPLDYLVKYASTAGIHFAVAAGNDNQDACMTSPGRASRESDIVTVGSINVSYQRSIFSNFGSCVTLYAPGEIIVNTGIGSTTATKIDSGSSMACPHIAGLMAVFLAQDPSLQLDTAKMKRKLIAMARRLPLDETQRETSDPGLLANNGNLER